MAVVVVFRPWFFKCLPKESGGFNQEIQMPVGTSGFTACSRGAAVNNTNNN